VLYQIRCCSAVAVAFSVVISSTFLGCSANTVAVRLIASGDTDKSEPFKRFLQRVSAQRLLSIEMPNDSPIIMADMPFWIELESVSEGLSPEWADAVRSIMRIRAVREVSETTKGGRWVCRDKKLLRLIKTYLIQGSICTPCWERKGGRIVDTCGTDQCDVPLVLHFEKEEVFLSIGEWFAEIDGKGLHPGQGYFLNGGLALLLLYAFEQPEFLKVEPNWLFPETFIGLQACVEKLLIGHLIGFLAVLADHSHRKFMDFLAMIDPSVREILFSAWGRAKREKSDAFLACYEAPLQFLRLLATDHASKRVQNLQISYSNPLIFTNTSLIRFWWCFLEEAAPKIGQRCPAFCQWRVGLLLKDASRECDVLQTLQCTDFCDAKDDKGGIKSPVAPLLLLLMIRKAATQSRLPEYEQNAAREILEFTARYCLVLTLIKHPELLERLLK